MYELASYGWRFWCPRALARALGRIGDARAVEPLAQVLRDKISYVRCEAAESLDELSWKPGNDVEKAHYLIAKGPWGELVVLGEPSIEPLIQVLNDDDKFVVKLRKFINPVAPIV